MAKRKQEWHGRCEFPLTDVYERGHVSTFGAKADPFCATCGNRRVWCECEARNFHPAPGYNVIVKGIA